MEKTLKPLIDRDELVMAIGAWDALTARMAQQAGAEAVYLSGSCVSSSVHGGPDVGLTTMTEMARRARQMRAVLDVPLIADADTGYGNELNVRRTVQTYEQAGVNAIQLEDQTFPKRCGHFEGKSVVEAPEFATKISAAVDARRSTEFLIIARTDAIAVNGLDDALDRAWLYDEAGADILFIEAPGDLDALERIGRDGPRPLLVNLPAKGKTPPVPATELEQLGFDIAIYPSDAFKAALSTIQSTYETLITERSQSNILDGMVSWEERDVITDLESIDQLESRYAREREAFEEAWR